MAADPATLQEMRDALLAARASGVQSVTFDGHRTEYKSDGEMAAAIADLERRIALASRRPGAVSFSSSKGM